jgi:integrase
MQRLSSVFSHAMTLDHRNRPIEYHPMKGGAVKPFKLDRKKRPRYLAPAEEKSLREALKKREQRLRGERASFLDNPTISKVRKTLPRLEGDYVDYLRPMVLLAMNCGLRRGELFNLRWVDVNLTTKMLTVEGEGNEDGEGSKSTQSRHIPLDNEALSVLKAWRKRHPKADGLVFPSPRDGERFTNVNKSWSAVRKSAGLKKFTFHHLRHTFASHLVQRGVPLYTVQALMGHADQATTELYAHLAETNLQAAVAKLNPA